MASPYRSSKPHHWVSPRPYTDATLRRNHYGPIQPMADDRPGLIARLFGRAR